MNIAKLPYIFDIQRFSIHDGPGIRTVLFTKACPLKCSWCQNPESQKNKAEVAFYHEDCFNCNKCVETCPNDAIDTISKISNYSACTQCGACIDACENDARRMIGKKMSKEEIITELLKDIDFFKTSNGGITFSGGEPLLHADLLYESIKDLKKHDIHINIETCGYFNFDSVSKLLPYVDLIYFDIKHLNSSTHKKFTGQGNEIILRNFIKLNEVFENIEVRVPLIPGVNDSEEHIKSLGGYLTEKGYDSIHLLPYHSMGNSKAIRIDHKAELFKAKIYTKEEINKIKSLFSKYNLNAIIHD